MVFLHHPNITTMVFGVFWLVFGPQTTFLFFQVFNDDDWHDLTLHVTRSRNKDVRNDTFPHEIGCFCDVSLRKHRETRMQHLGHFFPKMLHNVTISFQHVFQRHWAMSIQMWSRISQKNCFLLHSPQMFRGQTRYKRVTDVSFSCSCVSLCVTHSSCHCAFDTSDFEMTCFSTHLTRMHAVVYVSTPFLRRLEERAANLRRRLFRKRFCEKYGSWLSGSFKKESGHVVCEEEQVTNSPEFFRAFCKRLLFGRRSGFEPERMCKHIQPSLIP
jgi:hypothetical protein